MPDDFAPENPHDPELTEKLSLLRAFSQQVSTKPRRCIFRFGLSPVAIRGQDRVETIAFAQQTSRAVEDIDCGLVFRSVGRRTAPLAGVPYDEHRGVHANIEGRVAIGASVSPVSMSADGASAARAARSAPIAAAAWPPPRPSLRIWPRAAGQRSGDPDALLARLRTRVARIVSYRDWAAIDAAEKRRGALLGKPREKFVSVPDMLAAMDAARHMSATGG